MSQNISLIKDGVLPLEVEQFILTAFLSRPDLLGYRLVRTSASIIFDEKKFKELFGDRHPDLCKSVKPLEIQFQYLLGRYPDKCWKVASCVFETGNLKFTASLAHEGWLLEVKLLEDEISRKEPKLKKLWGDYYQHSASQCHQAWLAHTETQNALGNDAEAFADSIVKERKLELAMILSKIQPVEDTFHEIIAFDERLLPYANFMRHKMLKEAGDDLFVEVRNAKVQLAWFKNPGGLFLFKYRLGKFFKDALKDQIVQLINKQEPLTGEECDFILSRFNVWIEAWRNDYDWPDYAKSAYRELIPFFPNSANAKKIKPLLSEFAYKHIINLHANKPIESHTLSSLNECKLNVNLSFTFEKHEVNIMLDYLQAIYEHYHLINADGRNPSLIPANIKTLTDWVYANAIPLYAHQPPAAISESTTNTLAKKLSYLSGIPLETVLRDLDIAIKQSSGPRNPCLIQ